MFFKKKRNYNHLLTEFIDSFALLVDPAKILTSVRGRLLEFFDLNEITYLTFKADVGYINVTDQMQLKIPTGSHLVNWLSVNSRYLEVNQVIENYIIEELKILDDLQPRYIFPLETHNKIVALAIIDSNEKSLETLKFFSNVFRLTAIAYENADRIRFEKKKFAEEHENEKMAVIGRMASLLAHEIKNPLTAIRSSIQFLQKLSESEDLKDIAGGVIDEVDRVNDITNSLLQFARPQKVIIGEFKLIELLHKIEKIYKTQLSESKIKFSIRTSESERLLILGDSDAFQQIFVNFLQNSIDALHEVENPTIDVKIIENNGRFTLEWEDNGIGIPSDKLSKIFEPFFTSKKQGNGLGLAITKRLLENQNYHLRVSSKPGKGTKFYFNFDVVKRGRSW
jgi:signal transduction histidine kinase